MKWMIYILECNDSSFYTGITNNLKKRLEAHNQGKGAKYTQGKRPVELVYKETCLNRSEASKREYSIKLLTRDQKKEMINKSRSMN